MSQFLSELCERLVDPFYGDGTGLWQLTAPLKYYSAYLNGTVEVPFGFAHDHASVPRVPFVYANFGNRYHRPAVIHDYLCRQGYLKRNKCDRVFLEAMRQQNADELAYMQANGQDAETIASRGAALEGRAQMMFAAVVLYSKSKLWASDEAQTFGSDE